MNIILEDLKAQREGLLALGFWALLVYRFGHARFVIRNKIIRAPWTIVYMILHKLIEIFCGICIGATATIGRRLRIEHSGCICIHGAAVIGDDCMIRQGVTLGNIGYGDLLGAPTIGNRVQIGAGAKVVGRVKVGNDVTIGPNAVVISDVPDNVVVFGIPARVFKSGTAPGTAAQSGDRSIT
ncbi:MAG: serine acetyltransferase [Steroidobacteraceae bacterium]|jgi:serine O-acetyltransferase